MDGPKHVLVHVYFKSDGQSGDIVNQVILDPKTDLSPSLGAGRRFVLVKVWYGLAGPDVKLSFDDGSSPLSDFNVWVIPGGTLSGHVNFAEFGGIIDSTPSIDANGKLLLSTTGLTTTADQGTLIIKLAKAVNPFVNP